VILARALNQQIAAFLLLLSSSSADEQQEALMTSPPQSEIFQVVAATDFSELGDRSIVEALHQAKLYPRAELHVITVVQAGDRLKMEQRLRERVEQLISPDEANNATTVERVSVYLAKGNPAKTILHLAEGLDADLIVIGTHGKSGIKKLVLGSVAAAVVANAPCGVFVIRPRDFLAGEKVPEIEPVLPPGQHPLQPFHRAPTHHYVDRAAAASSRMFATW
jgi:nucleotide-binding universal stress UspA family protein